MTMTPTKSIAGLLALATTITIALLYALILHETLPEPKLCTTAKVLKVENNVVLTNDGVYAFDYNMGNIDMGNTTEVCTYNGIKTVTLTDSNGIRIRISE